MRNLSAAIVVAALFAPCFAHADGITEGAVGEDGSVTGPLNGPPVNSRSVGSSIGDDGAVLGPVGGVRYNNRSASGAIGSDGAVIGPVGGQQDDTRSVGGLIGADGTVSGPVGGPAYGGRTLGGSATGGRGALGGGLGGALGGPIGGTLGSSQNTGIIGAGQVFAAPGRSQYDGTGTGVVRPYGALTGPVVPSGPPTYRTLPGVSLPSY